VTSLIRLVLGKMSEDCLTARLRASTPFGWIKSVLKHTLLKTGSVQRVLWGPCRGMRYRIFPGYGHAYLYGGWERKCMRVISKYIKPGSTAYDLGANYGMYTLLLARLVGPSGRVYAFEPDTEVLSNLNEQLFLNWLRMVKTIPLAVSDKSGLALFDRSRSRATGHLLPERVAGSQSVFQVRTTTLDTFVFEDGNSPPTFVKIDIEGSESAALRGATRVISQYRPTFIIELHNPSEDRAVGVILKRFGYLTFQVESGRLIKNMESGWPDRSGMWGTVLALPSSTANVCVTRAEQLNCA